MNQNFAVLFNINLMLEISTSSHVLTFFPGSEESGAPYFSLAQKRQRDYTSPQPLKPRHELSIEQVGEHLHKIKLAGDDIGEFNDSEEGSAAHLAQFVSQWRDALSELDTKTSPSSKSTTSSTSTSSSDSAVVDHSRINQALSAQRDEFISDKPVSIRLVTWNIHGARIADHNLDSLLGFPVMADIYVVCLQEADLLGPRNLYANPATIADIKRSVVTALGEDYEIATSNQLLGIKTVIFVRSWLKSQIGDIRKATTGTGLFGVWGNKGAAGIWLTLGGDPAVPNSGTEIGFINCHLSAGEGSSLVERRRWELGEIAKKIKADGIIPDNSDLIFTSEDAQELSITDLSDSTKKGEDKEEQQTAEATTKNPSVVFLLGDLNYRIHHLDSDMVCDFARKKDFETILVSDQLSQEMKEGKILTGYQEAKVTFPPSYKYFAGSNSFDTSERIPSYTDRILYTKDDRRISVDDYSLGSSYTVSDHKPVMARVELTLPIINQVARKEILNKILKEWDQEENAHRPLMDVSPLEVVVDDAVLFEEAEAWISIKHSEESAAKKMVQWELIMNVGTDEPVIRAEPISGDLPFGATQKVRLSFTPDLQTPEIKHVVIVRIRDGQDIFVTIDFKSLPSCLGAPLDVLSRMPDGARSGKIMDQSSTNMPLEIWNCIDYLWTRTTPDMFEGHGESSLRKQVQEWLDNGQNFDIEVLDTANKAHENIAVYSVASQFLLLLRSLPEKIVPVQYYTTIQKGAEGVNLVLESIPSVNVNVLIYIAGFLHKAIEDGVDEKNLRKYTTQSSHALS